MDKTLSLFWFRRDLRLHDNAGLFHALKAGHKVLPLFIFDQDILLQLEDKADRRVQFIHHHLQQLHKQLIAMGSGLLVRYGKPHDVIAGLTEEYRIGAVYTNHDYEPYAIRRDKQVHDMLQGRGIQLHTFKDQVIFEKQEVVKDDGIPYTVWTPYSKKWKTLFNHTAPESYPSEDYSSQYFAMQAGQLPELEEIGFQSVSEKFAAPAVSDDLIRNYHATRDFPALPGTSRLSVHLRFGTISIRKLVERASRLNEKFLNELIWREFYQMILWHFPEVVHHAFRREYDHIAWRNDEAEFKLWCEGKTGFPIVDAGMRELNATGYMHNRVRMITASFLTKDLLIDWRWGEAYFAEKLLDFELASNNGGWQWAAGTGVDAAPYFRIFNPESQAKKFDPENIYIRKWVPELDQWSYSKPMVDHQMARARVLKAYKEALR